MKKVHIIDIDGNTNNKLQLIKAIKSISGLGLKEAKEIADEHYNTGKRIVLETVEDHYGLDEINQELIPSGYKVIYSDVVLRDITIAETLAVFKVMVFDTNETTLVIKGGYEINDRTGCVEIIVEEGTIVKSDYETEEITNSKFITHISRLMIRDEN